ncbi:GNAT family N-acetyltransferase [Sphingomonas sp. MA1305]|uniref:GNAT family N-acetyltransferase n=1 Tax=Sphingomonas sp. MA1305 TaxID=2479204 RepID=UPI0018DF6AF5|nr:GNAT family N-acetyltransferase [Sphingomonas sp. MA1305]
MTDVALQLIETQAAHPARGRVPVSLYAIVADGLAVGRIVLRHGHDDTLRLYARQVGYAVDPAHRGHGHAAAALMTLRPIALAAGFTELWIACAPDHRASRRTLEKAGAVFVETVDLPPSSDMYARGERRTCRYRLDL